MVSYRNAMRWGDPPWGRYAPQNWVWNFLIEYGHGFYKIGMRLTLMELHSQEPNFHSFNLQSYRIAMLFVPSDWEPSSEGSAKDQRTVRCRDINYGHVMGSLQLTAAQLVLQIQCSYINPRDTRDLHHQGHHGDWVMQHNLIPYSTKCQLSGGVGKAIHMSHVAKTPVGWWLYWIILTSIMGNITIH